MNLQTGDYRGDNRRNGARLRFSLKEYLLVGGIAITAVTAWVTLNLTVKAQETKNSKQAQDLIILEKENDEQNETIVAIQTDIKHIKEKVDKSANVQMQQMQILYEIKGALNEDG